MSEAPNFNNDPNAWADMAERHDQEVMARLRAAELASARSANEAKRLTPEVQELNDRAASEMHSHYDALRNQNGKSREARNAEANAYQADVENLISGHDLEPAQAGLILELRGERTQAEARQRKVLFGRNAERMGDDATKAEINAKTDADIAKLREGRVTEGADGGVRLQPQSESLDMFILREKGIYTREEYDKFRNTSDFADLVKFYRAQEQAARKAERAAESRKETEDALAAAKARKEAGAARRPETTASDDSDEEAAPTPRRDDVEGYTRRADAPVRAPGTAPEGADEPEPDSEREGWGRRLKAWWDGERGHTGRTRRQRFQANLGRRLMDRANRGVTPAEGGEGHGARADAEDAAEERGVRFTSSAGSTAVRGAGLDILGAPARREETTDDDEGESETGAPRAPRGRTHMGGGIARLNEREAAARTGEGDDEATPAAPTPEPTPAPAPAPAPRRSSEGDDSVFNTDLNADFDRDTREPASEEELEVPAFLQPQSGEARVPASAGGFQTAEASRSERPEWSLDDGEDSDWLTTQEERDARERRSAAIAAYRRGARAAAAQPQPEATRRPADEDELDVPDFLR